MVDWSIIGDLIGSFNFFNMGQELLPISVSIVVALGLAKKKRDFGLAFLFSYLIFFIIGLAKQVWILVLVAMATWFYITRAKDGNG